MTVKHHEGSNPLTMSYDAGNRITTSVLGSSRLTTFTHDANGNTTGERCDTLGVLSTYHTRFNEKAAGEVIAACGLANVCGPGGVYREGGGK
jgi:YD repeat-containing protein